MRQHAGSSSLRFVFSVLACMQGQRALLGNQKLARQQIQRQTDTALTPTQSQRAGQRLGLKAFQNHQQAGFRSKKPISHIAGAANPSQRNAGHGGLQCQHGGVHTRYQHLPQAQAPSCSL